jgi:23S rRNA (cytosine1962-C5)-methyltransferase
MNRTAIWPDFRDEWIVHDDPDLIVIDKPEGVSSQSADPERPDDIVTRLRSHFGGAYLGVHQRLDQDTSGLLVFARRREANAPLAAQFEGRAVRKTYVACVAGWTRREQVTLRDAIEPGDGKSMRIARDGRSGAKAAVTRVRIVARSGDRAMLELALETGRTHQARVQLAHAKAPIAGDALYGGPPAPRLMLHASGIEMLHPRAGGTGGVGGAGGAGARVRYESPPPPEFDAWLAGGDVGEGIYDDGVALSRALGRAVERRWGLGRSAGGARATTAFRLVNEEGDGLPRLAVDVYGSWLVAQLYGDDGPWADVARRERVIDALGALGFDGVYLKVRPKQANVLSRQTERAEGAKVDVAPKHPVRGEAAPDDVEILEEGMPLLVRLGDGLSTGLFLDQRNNRRRVRAAAEGKSVANLFAYTCAFTTAAALGGARRTVSVDVSAPTLERGRANLAHAGVTGGDHAFVADDVFSWLGRAGQRGERFDLVVLDPPSYSSTKRGRFVAEDDYVALAASAMALLAPGGQMLACTNHRGISRARFRRVLFEAGRKAKRELSQVKDLSVAGDYPVAAGAEEHLKSAWVTCV